MDCFGTFFTHVQTCDNVRVQSATQWTASVHALHMSKPVITSAFKVLRNGLLRYILVTMPGAVPPIEWLQQIRQSSLLEKADRRPGRSCCFLGGNRAWKSHATFLGLGLDVAQFAIRIVNLPKISKIQRLAFRQWEARRSWTNAGEVSKSSFAGRFR